MLRKLVVALLCAAPGIALSTPGADAMAGVAAFAKDVMQGPARVPQHYARTLPRIESHGGGRQVVPSLDIVAGRLDSENCLYQLRLELQWSGSAMSAEAVDTGGRSLIQKAPCASMDRELAAVAAYEVSALRRRLQDGGRFASNQERASIIAAVRNEAPPSASADDRLVAVTLPSRVNLRVSPSLQSPVLAKLAPGSLVRVARTASDNWYQLTDQPGYLHASALRSLMPDMETDSPAPPIAEPVSYVQAQVGGLYAAVHKTPSASGRVIGRLKPGESLRLAPAETAGWYMLEDGSGYVAGSALVQMQAPSREIGVADKEQQHTSS